MKKTARKQKRSSKKPETQNPKTHDVELHAASHFENSIAHLGPTLREEMQHLKDQEKKILAALRDPRIAKRFLQNPTEVLVEQGVNLPPITKRRLEEFDSSLAEHLQTQTFLLPNGQTVAANITINFTGAPKEEG